MIRLDAFRKTFFEAVTVPEATFPVVDASFDVPSEADATVSAVFALNGFIDASDIEREAQPTEEKVTLPPIRIVSSRFRRVARDETESSVL